MLKLKMNGIPRDNDTHTWSDFIELLALVNLDAVCSIQFALDRLQDAPEDDPGIDDDEAKALLVASATKDARRRAVFSTRLADALQLCIWRATAYGERYPFDIDMDVGEVRLKPNLDDANYSYLFLLMCGNLPFVEASSHVLTDGFEQFCRGVFEDVLPGGSEVHIFGKATANRYVGSKFEKFGCLSTDIRGHLIAKDDEYFRRGDAGDGGIDLVGWHELNDKASNIPVSFAQCACSREEWVRKQAEVMPDYLQRIIMCTPNWMPFIFLPLCFRVSSGDWAVEGEVKSVVLMDRLRIMSNCQDYLDANTTSNARALVDSVSASEGVV